ncbi:ATP-grasp domain-containing protein [Streptomyces sp. NPDC059272]|uniref:ATP-grasp domain-containing protein n=1 Tax=Streptomyces sp. NPDC059272 TaxID=3346800 RepID=UPI003684D39C
MSQKTSVLLVIGIGSQKDRDSRPYREHLLAGAARAYPLWLVETDELTWQAPYAVGSSVVPERTTEALVATCREVAARHDVKGVMCPDEGLLLAAAHVVADLGLPGAALDAVRACRDKKRGRRLMTDAGLLQPSHTSVRSAEELHAVTEEYGFPVVLKPRALGASSGVIKVEGPAQVDDAFAVTTSAHYPGIERYPDIMVEEYLEGPEISVDGSVVDGAYEPYIVAHKRIGPEPFFVETGHVVTAEDPALRDPQILDLLQRAHKALGFHHGMTHAEIKFTARGPVVIEINGRPGGDLIPRLGWLAAGVDLGWIAAHVAVGTRPPGPTARSTARREGPRTVGIRFCCPTQDCTVTGIDLPRPEEYDGLVEAASLVEAGDQLHCPPADYVSRFAYLIATGTDAADCSSRLDEVERAVTLHGKAVEPDAPPPLGPHRSPGSAVPITPTGVIT